MVSSSQLNGVQMKISKKISKLFSLQCSAAKVPASCFFAIERLYILKSAKRNFSVSGEKNVNLQHHFYSKSSESFNANFMKFDSDLNSFFIVFLLFRTTVRIIKKT